MTPLRSYSYSRLRRMPSTRSLFAGQHGSVDLSTANDVGVSLKSILESKSIPKVTFDMRHLSHILYHQHNVKLAGIHDLQLTELASRDRKESKKHIAGLAKCVEQDVVPPSNEVRKRWLETSNVDEYHMFNVLGHAPRSSIKRVELFPTLWRIYRSRLQRAGEMFWLAQARWGTETRVTASQLPKSRTMDRKEHTLGPETWYDYELRERRSDEWNDELMMKMKAGYELDEDANWVPMQHT